jgi:hypothetical protein
MRKHSKLILASLTATLLMALAVSSTATARVFSLSNMNFRVVWTSLEFTQPFAFQNVLCSVTLEGTFHSQTISKVEKALIGYVTRAAVVNNCINGRATIHQESLPWHITYNGFAGRLPNITGIRLLLNNARFQIKSNSLLRTCNVSLEALHEARGEVLLSANGEATELRPDESVSIPTRECEITEGQFRSEPGDGRITLLGNTTRIRVTLI